RRTPRWRETDSNRWSRRGESSGFNAAHSAPSRALIRETINRLRLRDPEFESALLQRGVCLSSQLWTLVGQRRGIRGGLRVDWDVRRGQAGREPALLCRFSLSGIVAVPLRESSERSPTDARAVWGQGPGAICWSDA